jgi:hypothetical protein
MIKLEAARKVARSLMGLDDRPATTEAFDALAKAFQLCFSEAEAEGIAENILRDSTNHRSVPKPGDIYTIIKGLRTEVQAWKPLDPENACPECQGTKWKIVVVNGIEGAERCECKSRQGALL